MFIALSTTVKSGEEACLAGVIKTPGRSGSKCDGAQCFLTNVRTEHLCVNEVRVDLLRLPPPPGPSPTPRAQVCSELPRGPCRLAQLRLFVSRKRK